MASPSHNPVLARAGFDSQVQADTAGPTMTFAGTMTKTFALLGIVAAGMVYAAMQGVVLGIVTLILDARFPGLPLQAALLTVATMGVMLVAYRAGVIRATERFRSIVVSCTAAIFVFYVIAFGMSLFGLYIPFLHEGGVLGIGFSLFVTALAAFNLILDFDTIEQGIGRAPAEMEWFAAFGLVVTLIWLY